MRVYRYEPIGVDATLSELAFVMLLTRSLYSVLILEYITLTRVRASTSVSLCSTWSDVFCCDNVSGGGGGSGGGSANCSDNGYTTLHYTQ